jgi:hypothetical protein
MGETRVDLLHLLEDLRDAYPGPAEETILTEIVANSLDSGSTTIAIATHPSSGCFTLIDDGTGMRRRELARYHDLAASTKVRGRGIGFAGVGIKMALLLCREVLTETRRRGTHVATTWAMASRHRAPWKWIPPPGLAPARGTAVRLTLDNVLSPLLDPGFIETALRRHFQPLLDPGFTTFLSAYYPAGIQFTLNGERLPPDSLRAPEVAPIGVRLARRRKPSASGYLIRDRAPLPEERRGLAISTLGKVIKRGWEWVGLTPADAERVGGLIEVPPLAECLTLNKSDFIRAGARGATYLAYRKAIQEAVSRQLAAWGDATEKSLSEHRRAARPVERDLESVLLDLAESFPLLASLVEQRAGGQRRLPVAAPEKLVEEHRAGGDWAPDGALRGEPLPPSRVQGPPPAAGGPEAPPGEGEERQPPLAEVPAPARPPAERGARRPGHYGLSIQFEARPDDPELGRLIESIVWVNEAHPAYRRAVVSRSEGYHIALAAALALASLAVEPAKEHAFVTAFLGSWGAAIERRRPRGRRSPRR